MTYMAKLKAKLREIREVTHSVLEILDTRAGVTDQAREALHQVTDQVMDHGDAYTDKLEHLERVLTEPARVHREREDGDGTKS